jgi:hypothetical protein
MLEPRRITNDESSEPKRAETQTRFITGVARPGTVADLPTVVSRGPTAELSIR